MTVSILGIGGSVHDFSSCLLQDGAVTVAVEEERLSRIKHHPLGKLHASDLQLRCVSYCLDAAGLSQADLDGVYANDLVYPPMLRHQRSVVKLNHHLTHAACCYFLSPFDHASILVMDGFGSMTGQLAETISYFEGDGSEIRLVKRFSGRLLRERDDVPFSWSNYGGVENSLGSFYALVSEAVGFARHEEGKLMGLAAYGGPGYGDAVRSYVGLGTEDAFMCGRDARVALDGLIRAEIARARSDVDAFQVRADFARAAQDVLEESVLTHVARLRDCVGGDSLCLAGGVFMNSTGNARVVSEGGYGSVFIHGAAGDSGTAIGAALVGYYTEGCPTRRHVPTADAVYTGRVYDQTALESALALYSAEVSAERFDDICAVTAQLLSTGEIVAWFQGRSEFGPRALGNRSILADPRDPATRDVINARVKGREWFRPLAPSVLSEACTKYFDIDLPAPFMTVNARVLDGRRENLGAVTHVDSTARVQTVDEQVNPMYHRLIRAFASLTGVPVLLNTSFNDNEPIVETPRDAIDAFLRTEIDFLVLGDYLVTTRAPAAGFA